jgi:hypothetical protein
MASIINASTSAGIQFSGDTSGALQFQSNGAATVNLDSSGNLTLPSTGGIGYGTGAGGTITQSTSKATGVTLNKITGQITLNSAALSAATVVSFVLTNSTIAATDLIVVNHAATGTLGGYGFAVVPAAGSATIYVRNNTAGSLSEAIVIQFAVIKTVTA